MKEKEINGLSLPKFMMKKTLVAHCLLLSLKKENGNLYPNPLNFIRRPHRLTQYIFQSH